jgi:hypothetical protein
MQPYFSKPRLGGGACSLALTLLRLNSLLTGKNTGNLRILALENALFSLQAAHFAGEIAHLAQIVTGDDVTGN